MLLTKTQPIYFFCIVLFLLIISFNALSVRHIAEVDSASYLLPDSSTVIDQLRSFRTPLYPLFLSITGANLDNYRIAAVVQCLIYSAAVLLIYHEISSLLLSPPAALLATVPLATASVLGFYGNEMLPETLGAALAFVCLAAICCRCRRAFSRKREIFIGITLLLAVLCKPQYAFLCGVHLISAAVLARSQAKDVSVLQNLRRELPRVFLPISPLFAYCLLRLIVVGHFGIVSFGGTNIAGIALNPAMFSTSTVETLPTPELKRIGNSILERREELIARSRSDIEFRGDDPAIRIHEVLDAEKFKPGGSFSDWVQSYNVNTWDVARPAVARSLGYQQRILTPAQNKEVDGILSELSSHAISCNRLLYVRYVAGSMAYSLNRSVRQEKWAARLITLLVALILVVAAAHRLMMLYKSGFFLSRSGICLITALLCTSAVLWEDVIGMTYYVWSWIPGTVSPQLLPVIAVFYGAFLGASYLFFGCSAGRTDSEFSRDHAAACCAAYCFGVMLLVSLVETPLDRYLMTAWPVMCSLCTALLWATLEQSVRVVRRIAENLS